MTQDWHSALTMRVRVERIRPGDLEGLLAVERASFSNPWTREMFLSELTNPTVSRIYVSKDVGSGEVIGFCAFWIIYDEIHINNLAVHPYYRGQGYGDLLLHHALLEGARAGGRRATLEVRRSNAVARTLYRKHGFVEAGVRKHYYTQPVEDAIILWRASLVHPSHGGGLPAPRRG